MIKQFHGIITFYENLNTTHTTVFSNKELHAQKERLKDLSILMNEFSILIEQLEFVDTSIGNREKITLHLMDIYTRLDNISWHVAHMFDFCLDVNERYRNANEELKKDS